MRRAARIAWVVLLLVLCASATTPPASDVTEFEINGLKVLVKRRPKSATVVGGLFIRGGVMDEDAAHAGLDNLLLTVMTEGSASYPRTRLRQELARLATVMNGGSNRDFSALTFGCTKEAFEQSWPIFADAAMHPALLPADIERDRSAILTQIATENDTPDEYVAQESADFIYKGHPYEVDPTGTAQTVAHFTQAELRARHRELMQTSRLLLVIVGDLDAEALKPRIARTLGMLPRGDYKQAGVPALAFSEPDLKVLQSDQTPSFVSGMFAAPPPGSDDSPALQVATTILSDRIFEAARTRTQIAYDATASVTENGAPYGMMYAAAADPNQLAGIMLDQILRMQAEPTDAETVSSTKAQYLTNYYLAIESSIGQASTLARAELIGGGWETSEAMLQRVNAVTPADVQRVCRKYMRNIHWVVLGRAPVQRDVFLTERPVPLSSPPPPQPVPAPRPHY